jgi:tape measure domain-containing protein
MAVGSAGELAVDLFARYDKLERQLASAERVVDRRLGSMESRGAAFASKFSGLLAGVGVAALAQQFLTLADSSKQMEAQLRLATATFGNFNQAQEDVARLAAVTRSGLAETTTLYGNMLRATQALGGTQADAARAAETFSKALKIGGANANEAASATLQFGQALASGALRGDEFASIAEASPRILKLLADSLGVTTGELRKLAGEGKLTSDVLQRAFTDTKFTAGIDAEFAVLPVTVDQAMTKVKNAAITTFGAFDRGGDFSNALANFVSDGAKGFGDLADDAEKLGGYIRTEFAALSSVFNPMQDGAYSAFDSIDARAKGTRDNIASMLGLLDGLENFGNRATDRMDKFFGTLIDPSGVLGVDRTRGRGPRTPVNRVTPFLAEYQRQDGQRRSERAERRLGDLAGIDRKTLKLKTGEAPGGTPTPTPTPKPSSKRSSAKASPLDPGAYAREEDQLQERLLRKFGASRTTSA